jgi:hypothetical protein
VIPVGFLGRAGYGSKLYYLISEIESMRVKRAQGFLKEKFTGIPLVPSSLL